MSQNTESKADAAEVRTQETRGFMQQVRVASRRKYTTEEKVRIVLEGFRREVAVNELCSREGTTHPRCHKRRHTAGNRCAEAGEYRAQTFGG